MYTYIFAGPAGSKYTHINTFCRTNRKYMRFSRLQRPAYRRITRIYSRCRLEAVRAIAGIRTDDSYRRQSH